MTRSYSSSDITVRSRRDLTRSHSSSDITVRTRRDRLKSDTCEGACSKDSVSSDVFSTLAPTHQVLIRELFAHYVGPGGMSSGAGLILSKFRRFLRDCGLLS